MCNENGEIEMKFDVSNLKWTREPEKYHISEDKIKITHRSVAEDILSFQK